MSDDLDDLRRRNAEMLAQSKAGQINSGNGINALAENDHGEPPRDQETPRRCAADFWNG